jgi:hypothetical protein
MRVLVACGRPRQHAIASFQSMGAKDCRSNTGGLRSPGEGFRIAPDGAARLDSFGAEQMRGPTLLSRAGPWIPISGRRARLSSRSPDGECSVRCRGFGERVQLSASRGGGAAARSARNTRGDGTCISTAIRRVWSTEICFAAPNDRFFSVLSARWG